MTQVATSSLDDKVLDKIAAYVGTRPEQMASAYDDNTGKMRFSVRFKHGDISLPNEGVVELKMREALSQLGLSAETVNSIFIQVPLDRTQQLYTIEMQMPKEQVVAQAPAEVPAAITTINQAAAPVAEAASTGCVTNVNNITVNGAPNVAVAAPETAVVNAPVAEAAAVASGPETTNIPVIAAAPGSAASAAIMPQPANFAARVPAPAATAVATQEARPEPTMAVGAAG